MELLEHRIITVEERASIPRLDYVFAFGPMLPLVAGAVASWWLERSAAAAAVQGSILWGGAILLFLSGVRRGLSFRTEQGPTVAQILTMLCVYTLGVLALGALWLGHSGAAAGGLIAGYAALLVLDPIAARRGEAPLYFARLRPMQLPIAIVSLCAILARVAMG